MVKLMSWDIGEVRRIHNGDTMHMQWVINGKIVSKHAGIICGICFQFMAFLKSKRHDSWYKSWFWGLLQINLTKWTFGLGISGYLQPKKMATNALSSVVIPYLSAEACSILCGPAAPVTRVLHQVPKSLLTQMLSWDVRVVHNPLVGFDCES